MSRNTFLCEVSIQGQGKIKMGHPEHKSLLQAPQYFGGVSAPFYTPAPGPSPVDIKSPHDSMLSVLADLSGEF